MTDAFEIRKVNTTADLLSCFSVRFDVFVQEQKVPFVLEVDHRDFLPSTVHILVLENENPVGTLRVIQDSATSYHLGRIAVLEDSRGRGLGRLLVEQAHAELAKRHEIGEYERGDHAPQAEHKPSDHAQNEPAEGVEITLDAQEYAIAFYERLEYSLTDRERFLDAGIWHREMRRTLP